MKIWPWLLGGGLGWFLWTKRADAKEASGATSDTPGVADVSDLVLAQLLVSRKLASTEDAQLIPNQLKPLVLVRKLYQALKTGKNPKTGEPLPAGAMAEIERDRNAFIALRVAAFNGDSTWKEKYLIANGLAAKYAGLY